MERRRGIMRGFYSLSGDDKEWDEEIVDDHKDSCCEDDDEDEREWCD
jgi:hypothetical protein